MSFKVKRTVENKDVVPSKELMELHCGFRRFACRPIYSSETNPGKTTEKFKYNRFLHVD
jgi:40S ribosome biogenesis protein Tsr1 and BMS1 C-terminal